MADSDITELYRLLRENSDRMADLTVAVARIEERLAARKECSAPGLCVDLDRRIRAIESREDERRGAWKTWATVGGVAGAVVAPIVTLALKKLF